MVDGVGEGAKVAGLVGGSVIGGFPQRPNQVDMAQMQNEILNALLGSSASMVKLL